MDDNWLSVTEAANRLMVSRMTVYRMIADGRLPAWNPTGRSSTRVPESAVRAILERAPS